MPHTLSSRPRVAISGDSELEELVNRLDGVADAGGLDLVWSVRGERAEHDWLLLLWTVQPAGTRWFEAELTPRASARDTLAAYRRLREIDDIWNMASFLEDLAGRVTGVAAEHLIRLPRWLGQSGDEALRRCLFVESPAALADSLPADTHLGAVWTRAIVGAAQVLASLEQSPDFSDAELARAHAGVRLRCRVSKVVCVPTWSARYRANALQQVANVRGAADAGEIIDLAHARSARWPLELRRTRDGEAWVVAAEPEMGAFVRAVADGRILTVDLENG